jgi:ubiquinone/menaquinone biosynthesis C-methylase UbiE
VSRRDAWSNPSAVSAEDAARMAAHLEAQAAFADQAQVNTALLDVLAPRPGERILEAGCGSGVLCRMVAPYLVPGGEMLGVDVAPDMIAAARRYAQGLAFPLRFETASGEGLPGSDASFDAAFAARLLLHVPDRAAIVRELARVVRPGGRIVLMDWDFETVTVDHSDRDLTRRLLHWRCDHHGGDNWSGRKLLDDALAAGLSPETVAAASVIARDETAALTGTLRRSAAVARDGGGITPAEHDAWIGEIDERLATGRFFASISYFIVKAQRGDAFAR